MPMSPLEKTFLRQNHFVWEGENRNSCSKNKHFEQKTIIWTTERGATNDGNLYEHLHRTSSSKYKIHGIKEISYFPPKKNEKWNMPQQLPKDPCFLQMLLWIFKSSYWERMFFLAFVWMNFYVFFSLHSNIWWEAQVWMGIMCGQSSAHGCWC